MLRNRGRPRRACGTCQDQKIRCTGERPCCKRCSRLKHDCTYDGDSKPAARARKLPKDAPANASQMPVLARNESQSASVTAIFVDNHAPRAPVLLLDHPSEQHHLGIPAALVSNLVELYFDNMYHSTLLLHKRLFLESVGAGTVSTHVLLSICAWGSHLYRDATGQPTLRDHGFMIEWAKRAGRLVFQEVEDFREESMVTFCNLAMFWHSQGSWRKSHLYKGNACQLLQIIGFGSEAEREKDPLESEIRRRRFWACYLMQCHSPEGLTHFEPFAEMQNLPLPWPEEDFDKGLSERPSASLKSSKSNGGILGELIQAITLWSLVVSSMKQKDFSFSNRMAEIYALDEKLSSWWRRLDHDFKLTASNIATFGGDEVPKVLLTNLAYHQSICILHASIIPLFSWAPAENSWSSARQLSAQIAFDHACAISSLNALIIENYQRLSAMPIFSAYAAYCSCAIQIPFMWCLDSAVRQQVHANVKTNVKIIQAMASYWTYASTLQVLVRCLYDIHKTNPIVLENEPKYLDVTKLSDFKITAEHARTSILEFSGVLRSKGGGYARPGEEPHDLGVRGFGQEHARQTGVQNSSRAREGHPVTGHSQRQGQNQGHTSFPIRDSTPRRTRRPDSAQRIDHRAISNMPPTYQELPRRREDESWTQQPPQPNYFSPPVSLQQQADPTDTFNPFFDAGILDLFPSGETWDLSQFNADMLNLDYLEMNDVQ